MLTAVSMLLSLFALLTTALVVGPTLTGAPVDLPSPTAFGITELAQAHARALVGSIRLPTNRQDVHLSFLNLNTKRIVDEGTHGL